MNQQEKLQVLLPHWIEHNQGHAEDCRKWTEELNSSGDADEVQQNLQAALLAMELVTRHLQKALDAAGGQKDDDGHGNHHQHY